MSALRLAAQLAAAVLFRWLCFAAMIVVAVWNESRPGRKIPDPLLEITPYVEWVNRWNYWIWLAGWAPWLVAFLFLSPRRAVRLLVSGGLLSLLRAVGLFLFPLGPVRGPDVNLGHDWDWDLRFRVVAQILNPLAVLGDQSAHVWLTKDMMFSGHAASSFLLLLYVWPHRRLRWIVALFHVVIVLSLFLGQIHYTIDVLVAWVAAYAVFALREGPRPWRAG